MTCNDKIFLFHPFRNRKGRKANLRNNHYAKEAKMLYVLLEENVSKARLISYTEAVELYVDSLETWNRTYEDRLEYAKEAMSSRETIGTVFQIGDTIDKTMLAVVSM